MLSVLFPLRFLFATEPEALTAVLGIVYRAISAQRSLFGCGVHPVAYVNSWLRTRVSCVANGECDGPGFGVARERA